MLIYFISKFDSSKEKTYLNTSSDDNVAISSNRFISPMSRSLLLNNSYSGNWNTYLVQNSDKFSNFNKILFHSKLNYLSRFVDNKNFLVKHNYNTQLPTSATTGPSEGHLQQTSYIDPACILKKKKSSYLSKGMLYNTKRSASNSKLTFRRLSRVCFRFDRTNPPKGSNPNKHGIFCRFFTFFKISVKKFINRGAGLFSKTNSNAVKFLKKKAVEKIYKNNYLLSCYLYKKKLYSNLSKPSLIGVVKWGGTLFFKNSKFGTSKFSSALKTFGIFYKYSELQQPVTKLQTATTFLK